MPQQTPYSLLQQISVEMCSTHQWNGNTQLFYSSLIRALYAVKCLMKEMREGNQRSAGYA